MLGSQPGPGLPQTVTVGLAEGDGSLPPEELWETAHPSISPPTPGHRHWHEWLLGTKWGLFEEPNVSNSLRGSHSEELRIVLGLRVTCWEEQNQLSPDMGENSSLPSR